MQKQQDIGKAHWLSKPTLVGGCHSPLPALQDPRSGGLVPTHSLTILPKIQTQVPLGQEIAPSHPVGGWWSRVPIRLRPQKFCGKGGKVVYHPYHLRILHPKRKQG